MLHSPDIVDTMSTLQSAAEMKRGWFNPFYH